MSIHPEAKPCSDLRRVLVINDPPTGAFRGSMDSASEANHSPPLSSRVASMDVNRKGSIDGPGSRKISMSGMENRKASIDGNNRASMDGSRRASIDGNRKVGRRNMLKPVFKAPGFSA